LVTFVLAKFFRIITLTKVIHPERFIENQMTFFADLSAGDEVIHLERQYIICVGQFSFPVVDYQSIRTIIHLQQMIIIGVR
jgi:hypothetical protein